MNKYDKKIVVIGGGVAGAHAITKLVDNGYPGELITVIDMGKNPYNRKPEEVMSGWLGSGGFSDGKLTYHHMIGGQLSKYTGKEKAYQLMGEVIETWRRFHPEPTQIMYSNPTEEPEFIKPHFGLRLFGVYHIGTDYLHEIGKNWYDYLVEKGVNFIWEHKVEQIDFENNLVIYCWNNESSKQPRYCYYDELIFAVGKSGIDFAQQLSNQYELPDEPKSVQIGVRFEAPQEHFQKLIDISYDFKLYRKFDDEGVSLRSFCTNNNAAYVAVEETYGDHSYNGHAKKSEAYRNNMTNFGILMEIKGIEDPFKWCREAVKKVQIDGTGTYYSPSRKPSTTSEGNNVSAIQVENLDSLYNSLGEYAQYIIDFIDDMKKIFPTLGDDWGVYIPEVKYLSPEVKVNYKDLSLIDYPNVHFVGDALSARGITVSGAQAIYVVESFLK